MICRYFTVCLFVILFAHPSHAADEVTVEGFIRDTANNPVKAVKVSLVATGSKDPIDTMHTDENGYYKIKRKIDSTYNVLYTHTQMDLALIELLAENRNQQISIKMYKRGEKRTASAYHENLQSVERLQFLILSLKPEDRKSLVEEYYHSEVSNLTQSVYIKDKVTDASQEILSFLTKKREEIVATQMQLKIGK